MALGMAEAEARAESERMAADLEGDWRPDPWECTTVAGTTWYPAASAGWVSIVKTSSRPASYRAQTHLTRVAPTARDAALCMRQALQQAERECARVPLEGRVSRR